MPFYQNPFTSDFEGNLLLGDRHHIPKYVVRRNNGRGDESVVVWSEPPYNLSGNDADGNSKIVLTFSFALHTFKNWSDLPITISASSLAATTAAEVLASLTADATFNGFFKAYLTKFDSGAQRLVVEQRHPATSFKFYVKNGRAESVLLFNRRAGVAEASSFFSRHTIANRFNYEDGQNMLIELVPDSSIIDANIINSAVDVYGKSLGYSSTTVRNDYALLEGRSGLFLFSKNTVDGSDRITQTIEYHAGAIAGDLARKVKYTYTGMNKNPSQTTEEPYVLQSADLVTP